MSSHPTLQQAAQLHAQGKHQEALVMLDACRRQGDHSPPLWQMMSDIFSALGMAEGEEKILHEGLKHHPANLVLAQALAHFYYRANRAEEGLALLASFTQQKDCHDEIRATQASLLRALGRNEEARALFEQVLSRHPQHVPALANLAGMHVDAREYEKAIPLFEQALAQDKTNSHIATQLAQACFRAGDLQKGWPYYEARFGLRENDPHASAWRRPFTQPLWQGEKLASNQPLLLWAEQGMGEEILYASMLADAQKQADRIFVECDPRLHLLFTRSFPALNFVARKTPPESRLTSPDIAFQAPMGHLGMLFRKNLSAFPKAPAYLKAGPQKTAERRAHYAEIKKQRGLSGLNIGISWRSKPLRHGDPKSTDLKDWQPLFHDSPHLFISLQYEEVREDFLSAPALYQDIVVDQKKSAEDFAAQTAAMDAVITVSNTTAHMAGALGIKTAVLLPASRGLMWHWFDKGSNPQAPFETSPWYAQVSLLRQTIDGDWSEVFLKVQNFIKQL